MNKEQKFYKALQDVFIGARIEDAFTPNPTIDTVKKINVFYQCYGDNLMK